VNQGIVEDSSEVSSHVSSQRVQEADATPGEEQSFAEMVLKKYDGDHSDLALSS
jgi:hypothetical protein